MKVNKEFYEKFSSDMEEMGLHYHAPKLNAVIKHLGPSIHNADASLVACSDEKETNYIKKEFLVGKLGLDPNDERLDEAIAKVCDLMGESNRHKTRITFYYMLMAILKVHHEKLA
mmetsp:Transcript_31892/g.42215  ORF Transcript_31892/g.42215 Transcript_31892/m.42215 type:complete len:115 (+) Transcript_31892:1-345(+)